MHSVGTQLAPITVHSIVFFFFCKHKRTLCVCDEDRCIDAVRSLICPFFRTSTNRKSKILNCFFLYFFVAFLFHVLSLSMQTCMHAHVQIVNMDPQQQFCLKWNSYSSNLAMTFSNYFKSDLLADVTLYCGGKWSTEQTH